MPHFAVRTADQLPTLIQTCRKSAGLTQRDVALRLGVSQQTYSALERNADKVGAARLLTLLHILGVEWVLATREAGAAGAADALAPTVDQPAW